MLKIGIVGATSLAGKELVDELQDSALADSNFVLLDEEEAAGKVTSPGDEAAFVQRLDTTSFDKMDFVFFTGDAEVTKKYWQQARKAGVSIVDMTYALALEKDVLVRSPLVSTVSPGRGEPKVSALDLSTLAVVAAHPAAVMLAMVAARLQLALPLVSLAATVMEPASEYGRAAMDELHQQTVNLLSFHDLPRDQYDAQVSFNLLPVLGEAAKVKLTATAGRIRDHYALLAQETLPKLKLQLIQAPVFHGYVASVLVEFGEAVTAGQIEAALAGEHMDIVSDESDPPSNLSAAGQEDVMVRVDHEDLEAENGKSHWLWLAADNLKFAALNAISCALELRRLRPTSKVQ